MEKTNVMRMLDKAKVDYKVHEYPHSKEAVDGLTVAKLLDQNPACVFKTLVTKGCTRDYYVFAVPVEKELDLKKAAKSVGEKSVAMIPVADINKVTGYIRGGCSPLGMKKQYRTVFASECREIDTIMVSAGKIGYQVELSPETLVELSGAEIADITI